MEEYFLEKNEEEVRKVFRGTMESQFDQDFYNESFSNQLESEKTDILHQRSDWWMIVVGKWMSDTKNVYDDTFGKFFGFIVKL